MEISRSTIGVFAALCVAAGAGGAYLLTGHGGSGTEVSSADLADTSSPAELSPSSTTIDAKASAISNPAPAAPAPARQLQAKLPERPSPRRSPVPVTALTPESPDNAAVPSSPAEVAEASVAQSIGESEPIGAPEAEPPVQELRAPEFEELVLAMDSVIGLQIETSITSDQAEVEDEVVARVTRDVRVGGKVAVPEGAKAYGEVTLVERGGRLRERARLGVRFTSLVLTDGSRVPLDTETIYREGDPPSRESAAKIGGGAIGGAIIGGIFGGAKGAAIGSSVGAGAGTAAALAGGRNAATLTSGTPVTIRLTRAATVTIDRP